MIFENIKKIGVKYNIALKDLSFLKISTFLDMYYDLSDQDVKNYLKKEISVNKKKYQLNKSIKLPDNIISNKDIYINTSNKNKINFFGKKKITGEIIILNKSKTQNLENKIICIENADPGYDFIFSKGILGLITKYGGVNSHMSIRCIESNTTAAIGIGHELYENIITKNYVTIDPDLNKIYSV
jgi:phosphohistidine swiveling domain-containing protein